MLWFYIAARPVMQELLSFQYISCYGSIGVTTDFIRGEANFNTSHVMVLLMWLKIMPTGF